MKKKNLSLIILCLVLIIVFPQVYAETGFTVDQDLYFTGSDSSWGSYYLDGGSAENLDVGIELCGHGTQYVGGFYALNDGAWEYALITYKPTTGTPDALGLANNPEDGSCFSTAGGAITVSENAFSSPSPEVYRSAFPGRLWIGYDGSSSNPGTISDFEFSESNAYLHGSYLVSRRFDQSSREMLIGDTRAIYRHNYDTGGGDYYSRDLDSSGWGPSDERPLVAGVCDDDYGEICHEGDVVEDYQDFPLSYSTGLSSGQVNDQNTYTKYVVLNGLGYSSCIGANLESNVDSISPDPVYYGQTLDISFSLTNDRDTPYETEGGNVDVTTSFDAYVKIYQQGNSSNVVYENTFEVDPDPSISPDTSAQGNFSWQAIAHSGTYVVRVVADYNGDISECDEGDNNATRTFELKPITIPEVFIDGVETSVFNYPNVPYNLKLHLENSDGDILNNASVQLIEKNGLSLTTPTQTYNISTDSGNSTEKGGLVTRKKISFVTNYAGNASFTIIPTYNPLYLPRYNYTNIEEYIGNYSLFFNGTQSDGEDFIFINLTTEEISGKYTFSIDNLSYSGDYSHKSLNNELMVSQVMDFIYHAFSNFLEVIIS